MEVSDIKILRELLEEKVEKYNRPEWIETDPVQIPKQFTLKENIEIAGFLASTISWGSRTSIIKNAFRLMSIMDNDPFGYVMNATSEDYTHLKKFVHRTFNGDDCIYFIKSLKNIYSNHSGLQNVFETGFKTDGSVKNALIHFHSTFFKISGERTRKHVANVAKGSSAKRLNMFLRWMVRNDSKGVDFGIWDGIPVSGLMLPLDVHTGNIARILGLLQRKYNDWEAVEEVTANLRKFDQLDPVKYDFALFGLGAFEKLQNGQK
ncbi:MAG: TIGR02757 family protein [Prolixibacteraceae bacterium]|nr:TIGR02757 family protein [Prolixibacteraceae bacterium]